MSHPFVQKRQKVSETITQNVTANVNDGPIDFTATTADIKFAWAPGVPIAVTRFGILAKTAVTGNNLVLTLNTTATLTDLSSPTAIATLSLTATCAANTGVYRDVATAQAATTVAQNGGELSNINVGPLGPADVNPGMAFTVVLTTPASVGTGWIWVEYVEKPFAGTQIANMVKVLS